MEPIATGSPRVQRDTLGQDVRRASEDNRVSIEIDSSQSMLWSETDDRPRRDPERHLLDAITVTTRTPPARGHSPAAVDAASVPVRLSVRALPLPLTLDLNDL
jgi:hypothetical protein